MNQPTPAIVSQSAARRLPRAALLLLCLAYLLPGLIARAPWKSADMASFGYMLELARGNTGWMDPRLMGLRPEADGLLPYWLGAWAIQISTAWLEPAMAARLPFFLLLALAMGGTWCAAFNLARSPRAQPVAFAFGGEALPSDYARAIADGAVLALIACLGLAQLSHEITTSVAQLAFTALSFLALAALQNRPRGAGVALGAGLLGLTFSGAPSLAAFFGLGGALLHLVCAVPEGVGPRSRWRAVVIVLVATLLAAFLAWR
ncbi:MAG: hypothetical protein ABIN37_17030, partial [Burkholderiaceae bacterium]